MWGEFGIAASRNSSLFSGSVWMCSTLLFVNFWWDGSQSWTVSLTLICLDFYLIFLMVRSCCLNPKLLFAVQFDCRHKCSSCVIYDSGALRVRFRDLWVFKNIRSRSGLLLGRCLMVCHLAGLFNMLSDNSHETRKQADAALSEFLQEIKNAPVLNCSLQEFSLKIICKSVRGLGELSFKTVCNLWGVYSSQLMHSFFPISCNFYRSWYNFLFWFHAILASQ